MKLLLLSDSQIGAGRQLADDRLADQEQVLDAIADLAHALDVDAVIHLGDVFETRHPGEEERMVFKRWCVKVTGHHPSPRMEQTYRATSGGFLIGGGPRLIVVAGNHDLSNTALASAVDLYDRCEFVRLPQVIDLGGCSLACLPWAPIHNLVAARDGREGVFEQAAEALVAIALDLREQCPAGKPALLAAHWAISGASLPSGMSVDELGEVILPGYVCDQFTYTIGGHIHKAGSFRVGAMYCGSPYPCSFGEPGEHGCWALDSERFFEPEFVPLASRPLVTIDCDLTLGSAETEAQLGGEMATPSRARADSALQDSSGEGAASHDAERGLARLHAEGVPERTPPGMRAPNPAGAYLDAQVFAPDWDADLIAFSDETDRIAAAVAEHFPLTDATVRLRFTCTEAQHSRVKIPKLRDLIMDAGAHRVSQIEPTIIRQDRARAAVDESMEPGRALAAWCEANSVGDAEREGLQGLLARWSA